MIVIADFDVPAQPSMLLAEIQKHKEVWLISPVKFAPYAAKQFVEENGELFVAVANGQKEPITKYGKTTVRIVTID